MITDLTWEQAEHLRYFSVCCDCWEPLTIEGGDGKYTATCQTAGCHCPAATSTRTVLRRKKINEHQLVLARRALRDAIPWLQFEAKGSSESELLASLGYGEEK